MRAQAACHPGRRYGGRGLCVNCRARAAYNGTLHDHPTVTRAQADFIADYTLLRAAGHNRRAIAERLGMSRHAVQKAYSRALAAGKLQPDRRPA